MYWFWIQFSVQFYFLKKLKYKILSSHFYLFQNSLRDLLTSFDFIEKNI